MSQFRIVLTHTIHAAANALAKAPREVLLEADRALKRGATEVAREARARAPKGTEGSLSKSIRPHRISLLEYHITAARDYASYQEEGTGAGGRPTIDAMLAWIRRKRITPRPGMSPRSLASLIRLRIAQRGVPDQPFMRTALEAQPRRLDQLMREGVARGLQRIDAGRAL